MVAGPAGGAAPTRALSSRLASLRQRAALDLLVLKAASRLLLISLDLGADPSIDRGVARGFLILYYKFEI